jgi:hypothetical protein
MALPEASVLVPLPVFCDAAPPGAGDDEPSWGSEGVDDVEPLLDAGDGQLPPPQPINEKARVSPRIKPACVRFWRLRMMSLQYVEYGYRCW